jgi:hypothetical protein
MQNGGDRTADGDAAGEWLRKNLKDKPDPKVSIEWETDDSPRPAQRARLLEILFGEDVTA